MKVAEAKNDDYDPWKLLALPLNSDERKIEHWDAEVNAVSTQILKPTHQLKRCEKEQANVY